MTWIDIVIVVIPLLMVLGLGVYCSRFAKGVADFLSSGRICGRYVLCSADVANSLSIIGLIMLFEMYYQVGFGVDFWKSIGMPVSIIIGLTGFCHYRYRETKVLSFGQFLEMRYGKSMRVFGATLRVTSEVLSNMIMPAVAGRFFIYFFGLPHKFTLWGMECSTFMVVMAICTAFALVIIWSGGSIALIVTDSFQGIIFYPLLAIFIIFLLKNLSWSGDVVPVLCDRAPNESFLNPYDISDLRDFNSFYVFVTVWCLIWQRASWIGSGNHSAAKSPHEQKMAGLLGTWRGALVAVFNVTIAIVIVVTLNGNRFAPKAKEIRNEISNHVIEEIVTDKGLKQELKTRVAAIPQHNHIVGKDAPLSNSQNLDTPYIMTVRETIAKKAGNSGQSNSLSQQFRSLYHQVMLAVSMRHLLPVGLMGAFCVLMVLAMISTDDTRIFSSALTITQDSILPFVKKDLTPKQHIMLVRIVALCIGVLFFLASSFMAQLDYLQMFTQAMSALWMGGCGPVMIFGLYSRFGTKQGAWTSLVVGMVIAALNIIMQRNWVEHIYPWLERMDWVDNLDTILNTISHPFNPVIVWRMNPYRFPINSYESYFLNMVITGILYVVVSKLTCKEPFNLDRMLHRGIYNTDGTKQDTEKMSWSPRSIIKKLVGITPEYTRGDKILAWTSFGYSMIYKFLLAFIAVIIWNSFSKWSMTYWSNFYLVTLFIVPCIIAAICTFWLIGGAIRDMKHMFHDLKLRADFGTDALDNGSVSADGIARSDVAEFQKREEKNREDKALVAEFQKCEEKNSEDTTPEDE